jgi:hypothetical protein
MMNWPESKEDYQIDIGAIAEPSSLPFNTTAVKVPDAHTTQIAYLAFYVTKLHARMRGLRLSIVISHISVL